MFSDDTTDLLAPCELCSQHRFFKGKRGLSIHVSQIHRCPPSSQVNISSSSSPTLIPFWKKLSLIKQPSSFKKDTPWWAYCSDSSSKKMHRSRY